jgi:hypothetical protein
MEKIITEQQDVIVNRNNDLYMTKEYRKYIGQVCTVQKQCKNGKFLVKHSDGSTMAFAKKNLDISSNIL